MYGITKKTVILNPKASVNGFTVEIGMGFDKTKNNPFDINIITPSKTFTI